MNVYEIVTAKIVEALERGVLPWRRTWTTMNPMNAISKKEYRGINHILLSMQDGFQSPYWVTYNQATQLGGNIKPKEKSTIVVFWKTNKYTTTDDNLNDEEHNGVLLRYYHIFNLEQCENVPENILAKYVVNLEEKENNPIANAEALIKGYVDPPVTKFSATAKPSYSPTIDTVHMPAIKQFEDAEEFYSTYFHELVHSTGHKKRLGRIVEYAHFGSELYSKEELVAEIGAAFLASHAGIEHNIDNHAAYVKSWLKVLKNDSRMIISASSQAQKACDLIKNIIVSTN
jgi:antirestriction protein ArdC